MFKKSKNKKQHLVYKLKSTKKTIKNQKSKKEIKT